ncbi:MAG: hypothetical protein ACOYNF_15845 [Rhodoferax sp.]
MVAKRTGITCPNDDSRRKLPRLVLTSICHLPLLSWITVVHFRLVCTMRFKVNFFRLLAIPACLAAGLLELICLQRSRFLMQDRLLGWKIFDVKNNRSC